MLNAFFTYHSWSLGTLSLFDNVTPGSWKYFIAWVSCWYRKIRDRIIFIRNIQAQGSETNRLCLRGVLCFQSGHVKHRAQWCHRSRLHNNNNNSWFISSYFLPCSCRKVGKGWLDCYTYFFQKMEGRRKYFHCNRGGGRSPQENLCFKNLGPASMIYSSED